MGKYILHRHEIDGLIQRLNARGTSKMLRDQPELTSDLRLAAATLRAFQLLAMTLTSLEVDPLDMPFPPPTPEPGEAK